MPETTQVSARRGRPPRVTRAMIVETARSMDPATLTMQAVADALGVDRKTVHYHVADRDQLMQLVANESFRAELNSARVDDSSSWQDAIKAFAAMVREASLKAGALSTHFTLHEEDLNRVALMPAEVALRALLRDGFDEVAASHLLRTAGLLGSAYARESETERRQGSQRQRAVVDEALRNRDDSLPALRHLVDAMPDVGTDAAFGYAVDALILGAEKLRDSSSN